MKLRYTLPSLLLGLWLLSGCTKAPEWTLFYYPNTDSVPENSLQVDDINGYYDTLEQCQRKALGMQRLSQSSTAGAYQCGHLCEIDANSVLVCKALSQ